MRNGNIEGIYYGIMFIKVPLNGWPAVNFKR
jgi:hypothetical protein